MRLLKEEAGTDLLEFAIISILLLMLLFGICGMGQMLYSYHFVSSVARDATRYAAVNGATCMNDAAPGSCTTPTGASTTTAASAGDIATFVADRTPQGIDSSQVTVASNWFGQSGGPAVCGVTATQKMPGCTVQVTVSYKYTFIFPLIRTSPLNLSSTSEMIIAH